MSYSSVKIYLDAVLQRWRTVENSSLLNPPLDGELRIHNLVPLRPRVENSGSISQKLKNVSDKTYINGSAVLHRWTSASICKHFQITFNWTRTSTFGELRIHIIWTWTSTCGELRIHLIWTRTSTSGELRIHFSRNDLDMGATGWCIRVRKWPAGAVHGHLGR